jgi:hypothetical protein
VLGKRVTRRARADYKYTPEWEYIDLRKRALYVGWAQSMPGITVRTLPSKDGTDGGTPWEDVDILAIGEVWNIVDAIEEQCRAEDARRKEAAGQRRGKNGA